MKDKKSVPKWIKDWWNDNKKAIKVGITCGFFGILYGFIKGMTTTDAAWLKHGYKMPEDDSGDPDDDDFEYTADNVDDPELLELIKSGEVDS